MSSYTKDSIEALKQRIDIHDLISGYVNLKGAGSMYKGLCPFHQEKTPSFTVHRHDGHYHCFGCGAHGDAIAFVRDYMNYTFVEAVEFLAQKYQVTLEKTDGKADQNTHQKKLLKEALERVATFYHGYLMHTEEGKEALHYLYTRGLDLDFIQRFGVGFAPFSKEMQIKAFQSLKLPQDLLMECGVLRDFKPLLAGRIIFPIINSLGQVIGFSGRKIREDRYGPKYVNTPETVLFKKSETLYGLYESRKRIAKEKKAMIVEGQIDALRLIQEGLDFSVASQGTAFTQSHAEILIKLGVSEVYLAFDGDQAGKAAAVKVGNFFQSYGIEVFVLDFERGEDPDSVLMKEGAKRMLLHMKKAKEYLSFLVTYYKQEFDVRSPSGKTNLVKKITSIVRNWDHPLMVHESLRKLAFLLEVPEALVGVEEKEAVEGTYYPKTISVNGSFVDGDQVLEADLLRWLLIPHDEREKILQLVRNNLTDEHLYNLPCRRLFEAILKNEQLDLLQLTESLTNPEEQLLLSELLKKRINREKVWEGVKETMQKILERHWLRKREQIKRAIHSGRLEEEQLMQLAKEFDQLISNKPCLMEASDERAKGEL